MVHSAVTLGLAMPLLCAVFSTNAAAAQRTFVASYGVPNPSCSISSPCRAFATAAANTDPGGEIIVLDSAGYGPVSISQSLSILAPAGVYAGISVFSGDGITINGAGIAVMLRGLDINGQGGNIGISVSNAGSISVERTTITRMMGYGIQINAPAKVTIADVVVRECNQTGIYVLPTKPSNATVLIERARIENNDGIGINFDNNVTAQVIDSTITRNTLDGIRIYPDAGEFVDITLARNTISENVGNGIHVEGGGFGNVWLDGNLVARHFGNHGVYNEAASIGLFSRENNSSVGNSLVSSPANYVSPY